MPRNTKARTEAMQARAMEIVEIQSLSDEAQRLIDETLETLGLEPEGNRWRAFKFLQDTGGLADVDIGGQTLNAEEAIEILIEEFGCVKSTARSHVARAARRKRHPDYQAPQRGGARRTADYSDVRNFTNEQVRQMRRARADGATYAQIAEEFGTDPGNAYRIVKGKTYKHVE